MTIHSADENRDYGSWRTDARELAIPLMLNGGKFLRFSFKAAMRSLVGLNLLAWAADTSSVAELRDRATEFLQTEKVVIGAVIDLVPDKIGLAYGSLKGRDVFGKKLADIFEAGSYVIGGVAVMTLQPDVPVGTPSTPKDAPAP